MMCFNKDSCVQKQYQPETRKTTCQTLDFQHEDTTRHDRYKLDNNMTNKMVRNDFVKTSNLNIEKNRKTINPRSQEKLGGDFGKIPDVLLLFLSTLAGFFQRFRFAPRSSNMAFIKKSPFRAGTHRAEVTLAII